MFELLERVKGCLTKAVDHSAKASTGSGLNPAPSDSLCRIERLLGSQGTVMLIAVPFFIIVKKGV
jgi:hypothetical protein